MHTDVWAKRVKQKATKVLVKLHATPARTVAPPFGVNLKFLIFLLVFSSSDIHNAELILSGVLKQQLDLDLYPFS